MKTRRAIRYIFTSSTLVVVALIILSLNKNGKDYKSNKKQPNLSQEQWVQQTLSKLSTEEKIAQSLMIPVWSNKGETHLKEVESEIQQHKIGGLIFFQGERKNLMDAIDRFQSKTEVPLLIGMDAEWGVAMRIAGEDRFPYAQTIGAANDLELTRKMGEHMGIECEQLGIHLSFSPVADVNSNPKNPVIGFRSFGSDPNHVAKHTAAFVDGMEGTNILSCVKHFPGHGDTDKDSHLELPVVSHDENHFKSVDFLPFKQGIQAGTSAVMVAHLQVPKLDPNGLPSSLSKKIIQHYLRQELGFKGLVISDALNMKAVSDKYGKAEVVAMAYIAGCDILLYPESTKEAITLIKQKIDKGELSLAEVNARCKRVLEAKYRAIISKPQIKRKDPSIERNLITNQVFEKAITVIKNDKQVLPLDNLDRTIIRIGVGPYAYDFQERLSDYAPVQHLRYFTISEAIERLDSKKFPKNAILIVDLHGQNQRVRNNYGFGNWEKLLELLPEENDVIVSFFGNALTLENTPQLPKTVDACILAYENHYFMQDRVAQFIMGAFDVNGKLEAPINDTWKRGAGIAVKGNGRLKYTVPEEVGINRSELTEIDEIVTNAIQSKALPGCQIVVAIEGKVILQKSYGTTMYEKSDSVTNDHIYDLASITKIASSTMALMKLRSEGKFDVQDNLGQLTPELVEGTPYTKLKATDLLTHQAGLTPFIPFYKKTLKNGELDESIYSNTKKQGFSKPVAKDIWIKDDYWKTILKTIVETPLSGEKKYEYSDLSYYFFRAFIERVSGKSQNDYVYDEIYKPLGLQTMGYMPLNRFPLKRIVPTENDQEFRKQVVQGYVHDPGAAMMGGVAGHAGLFSNATDLAALMQCLMNGGQIGDYSLIKKDVVAQFTRCQYCPGNRRGLGFDKPTVSRKEGPTSEMVSPETFGHSGFTGTITWADPTNGVNYVFLSNRVYPDAGNKKIISMSIRTKIQDVIYKALANRK